LQLFEPSCFQFVVESVQTSWASARRFASLRRLVMTDVPVTSSRLPVGSDWLLVAVVRSPLEPTTAYGNMSINQLPSSPSTVHQYGSAKHCYLVSGAASSIASKVCEPLSFNTEIAERAEGSKFSESSVDPVLGS
jgi:hypothetical protein